MPKRIAYRIQPQFQIGQGGSGDQTITLEQERPQ